MKKRLPWINTIASIALSILIIILSLKFVNMSKELKRTQEVLGQQKLSSNQLKDKNDAYTYYENLFLNKKLDSSMILKDLSENTTSLRDLKISKPTIILFIHQTHCSSCWSGAVDIVVKDFPEIAKQDMIVFTSYQNFRDIVIPLQELNLSSNVYNLVQGSFGEELEKINVPFAITTDSSLLIKHLIFIDMNLLSQFKSYVNAFEERKEQLTN